MKALLDIDGFTKMVELDEPKLFYKYQINAGLLQGELIFIRNTIEKIKKQDVAFYTLVTDPKDLGLE